MAFLLSVPSVSFSVPGAVSRSPGPAEPHVQFAAVGSQENPFPFLFQPQSLTSQCFQNLPHSCSAVPLFTHPPACPALPAYLIPLFIQFAGKIMSSP